MEEKILIILFIFFFVVFCSFNFNSKHRWTDRTSSRTEGGGQTFPYLWIYWENKNKQNTPDYIKLCIKTIFHHCAKSFRVVQLNEENIYNYLPELRDLEKKINFQRLIIAHKVDFYRMLLLKKYGGLYLDADTIVLKNPIEIIRKLKQFDFVGFGCTGLKCHYGYGKPSNGILASRPNGILVTRCVETIIKKILRSQAENKTLNYFDIGKLVIWKELDKLIKQGYKYYHYTNDYDGTRDSNGYVVRTRMIFSDKKIHYRSPEKMLFLILYNSGMEDYYKKTIFELLTENTNFSKLIKKSLK